MPTLEVENLVKASPAELAEETLLRTECSISGGKSLDLPIFKIRNTIR